MHAQQAVLTRQWNWVFVEAALLLYDGLENYKGQGRCYHI